MTAEKKGGHQDRNSISSSSWHLSLCLPNASVPLFLFCAFAIAFFLSLSYSRLSVLSREALHLAIPYSAILARRHLVKIFRYTRALFLRATVIIFRQDRRFSEIPDLEFRAAEWSRRKSTEERDFCRFQWSLQSLKFVTRVCLFDAKRETMAVTFPRTRKRKVACGGWNNCNIWTSKNVAALKISFVCYRSKFFCYKSNTL